MNSLVGKLDRVGSNWYLAYTHMIHPIHIDQWSMGQLNNSRCIVFFVHPTQHHFGKYTSSGLIDQLIMPNLYYSEVCIEKFMSPRNGESDIGIEH